MITPKTLSLFKTAYLHAKRLQYAITHLETLMPVTAEFIAILKDTDFLFFELYSSRFSKLQDLIGASLFGAVLEEIGELENTMSLIDKINKLEKLGILEDSNQWLSLCQIRNSLSHEYPDQPQIMAETFNQAFLASGFLLNTLDRLHQFLLSKKSI